MTSIMDIIGVGTCGIVDTTSNNNRERASLTSIGRHTLLVHHSAIVKSGSVCGQVAGN